MHQHSNDGTAMRLVTPPGDHLSASVMAKAARLRTRLAIGAIARLFAYLLRRRTRSQAEAADIANASRQDRWSDSVEKAIEERSKRF
jgi:hypothetical protein